MLSVGKMYTFLAHKYKNFSKQGILDTADRFGLESFSDLETHLWVYELCYQIQKRTEDCCILKGGACAQLHLPLKLQRCTLDLDMSTTLGPDDLPSLLDSITNDFNRCNFLSSFRQYVPKFTENTVALPMKTYLFKLPFNFKSGRGNDYADIKIDFIFSEPQKLSCHRVHNASTIGLQLGYSPLCLTPYSMICGKLITFASNTVGLPPNKIEAFYKSLYDCYHLLTMHCNPTTLQLVSNQLHLTYRTELRVKNLQDMNAEVIIEDILSTLYKLFTWDLLTTAPRFPGKVSSFEERCLQGEVRKILNPDSWAVMAMYIFIWTSALKEIMSGNSPTSLNTLNDIETTYKLYVSSEKQDRKKLIRSYKDHIFSSDNRLVLNRAFDPLRIIYLTKIHSKLSPPVHYY